MPPLRSLRSLLPSCLASQHAVTEDTHASQSSKEYISKRSGLDAVENSGCSTVQDCARSSEGGPNGESDQYPFIIGSKLKVRTQKLVLYTVRVSGGWARFWRAGELQAQLPKHVVCRAAVLEGILSDTWGNEDTVVMLPLPKGVLQAWRDLICYESGVPLPTQRGEIGGFQLLDMVQAVYYLCDRESVDRLVVKAAEWLFAPRAANSKPKVFSTLEGRCLALQKLPEDLVKIILAAHGQHLYTYLRLLPTRIHNAAVHACVPKLAQRSSLYLPMPTSQNILHALGAVIHSLPDLQELTLSGDFAPKEQRVACDSVLQWQHISNLANVRNLALRRVALWRSGDEVLLRWLLQLSKLQHLDLSESKIRPGSDTPLYVSAISCLVMLSCVNLKDNGIGPHGAVQLAQGFSHLSILRRLNLAGNRIGPQGFIAICPPLTALSVLEDLDLANNSIGTAIHHLATVVPHISSLRLLNLNCNCLRKLPDLSICGVEPRVLQNVFTDALVTLRKRKAEGKQGLQFSPPLQSLDIGGNCFARGECMPFLRHFSSVRSLYVAKGLSKSTINQLLRNLERFVNLQELDCSGLDLTACLSNQSFDAIALKTDLTALHLRNSVTGSSRMDPSNTERLLDNLRRLTNLRTLDLSGVALEGLREEEMSNALSPLTCMEKLDLSFAGISASELVTILRGVNFPHLHELSFAVHDDEWLLGHQNANQFCAQLVRFERLHKLDLSGHYIQGSGHTLITHLSVLTDLRELILIRSFDGDVLPQKVLRAIQNLPAIEVVDLYGDGGIPLSDTDWRHFTNPRQSSTAFERQDTLPPANALASCIVPAWDDKVINDTFSTNTNGKCLCFSCFSSCVHS